MKLEVCRVWLIITSHNLFRVTGEATRIRDWLTIHHRLKSNKGADRVGIANKKQTSEPTHLLAVFIMRGGH